MLMKWVAPHLRGAIPCGGNRNWETATGHQAAACHFASHNCHECCCPIACKVTKQQWKLPGSCSSQLEVPVWFITWMLMRLALAPNSEDYVEVDVAPPVLVPGVIQCLESRSITCFVSQESNAGWIWKVKLPGKDNRMLRADLGKLHILGDILSEVNHCFLLLWFQPPSTRAALSKLAQEDCQSGNRCIFSLGHESHGFLQLSMVNWLPPQKKNTTGSDISNLSCPFISFLLGKT